MGVVTVVVVEVVTPRSAIAIIIIIIAVMVVAIVIIVIIIVVVVLSDGCIDRVDLLTQRVDHLALLLLHGLDLRLQAIRHRGQGVVVVAAVILKLLTDLILQLSDAVVRVVDLILDLISNII